MINVTSISLIQELRAIHALSEAGIKINIDKLDEHKFKPLHNYFNMAYNIGFKDGLDSCKILFIDHSKPSTSIFSAVTKPLIFPSVLPAYLKEKWPDRRKYKFGFSGFLTPKRENVIESWLLNTFHQSYNLKDEHLKLKIKRKLFFTLNIQKPVVKKFGKLFIYSSHKGRVFPEKSWDPYYYHFLLKAKFILCPSGVHVWTYRFFEAILCGAIPIVETKSSIYQGFKYYTMDENLDNIEWSKQIAEYNYKLCVQRITLSGEELEIIFSELQKTLNKDSKIFQ